MKIVAFRRMEALVLADSEGREIAAWARDLSPCGSAEKFRTEAIWVILCSGISFRAARTMERRHHETGQCNHPHKAAAIEKWEADYLGWWEQFSSAKSDSEKLQFLRTLPYMGGEALRFQMAKNMGITGYCKPDVHLKRIAKANGYSDPQTMCEEISQKTGLTVAYIDTVLWFAGMRGWAYQEDYK